MNHFEGLVVVITGASSGIGAEIAKQCAAAGAIPVLLARSHNKLQEVSGSLPGNYESIVMDVTQDKQVHDVILEVIERVGTIDVLINNAGYGIFEPLVEASLDHFKQMMDVNYMGTVRCTKAVLPHMLSRGRGHIINIASIAGKIGTAKSSGYSATKHAVLGFTNSLRQELAGSGVRISAVNPGPVNTGFFKIADPDGSYVKNVKWFMLTPDKVAKEVLNMIRNGRAEKDVPFVSSLGAKFFHLFPRLFEKLTYRLLNKK
jgi:short-subunit dehydrogenase